MNESAIYTKKAFEPKKRPIFKPFQIRWREPLGEPGNPYLIRWMFIFFNFSIRLHHWVRSDDRRFFHDHGCDLISIILKGGYTNVTPDGKFKVKAGSIWHAKAKKRHYLDIPKKGAWTLLLCGRPYHKWGFWVDGKLMRPKKYFKKYGEVPEGNEDICSIDGETECRGVDKKNCRGCDFINNDDDWKEHGHA